MTATLWVLIGATALMTAAVKAAGPVVLGGRDLPDWFGRVVLLMAPALLCALVITQTFAPDGGIGLGAHVVGVAAAGVVFLRGGSVITGLLVAVLVTAALRALGS